MSSSTQNTGRYSIGEKFIVAALRYQYPGRDNTPPSFRWNSFISPLFAFKERGVRCDKIAFKTLEVVEHHRVPGEWDDVVQYDGYILKDKEGVLYTNQYPRASYGQLSDTGDRLFEMHIEDKSEEEALKILNDHTRPFQYRLFTDYLNSYNTPKNIVEKFNKEPDQWNLGAVEYVDRQLANLIREFNVHYGHEYEIYGEVIFAGVNSKGENYQITSKSLRRRSNFEGDRLNHSLKGMQSRNPELKPSKDRRVIVTGYNESTKAKLAAAIKK